MVLKRSASRSPDSRWSKRQATDSPEEGELDDTPPPQIVHSLPPKPKAKVAFPFKTKPAGEKGKASSSRPAGDHWEPRGGPPRYRTSEASGTRRDDHWTPHSRPRYHRSRSRSISPAPSRDNHRLPTRSPNRNSHSPDISRRHRDKYYDGGEENDRGRRRRVSNERRRDWRDDDRAWVQRDEFHRGHRSQSRRDRSPRSRYADSYRPRSPESTRANSPGPYRDHPPAPSVDSYVPGRQDSIDSRRPASPTPTYRPHDTRPVSPSAYRYRPPTTPPLPPAPQSITSLHRPISPRQPPSPLHKLVSPLVAPLPPRPVSPPPLQPSYRPVSPLSHTPPLPDGRNLPLQHAAVNIAMPVKRPPAPKDEHSPPSMPNLRPDPRYAPPPPRVAPKKKGPMPSRMTDDEEKDRYARIFKGCGRREDYNMTTKLGEGTFGEVHKAVHKKTGAVVALKRIMMHNEKEGMPVTALREIKILKALQHPCVVSLLDMFVVRSSGKDPLSVYMVFPYMDHDLAGLLENERVKLSPSQIKLYMKQLLEGTHYMHQNSILHRDMKAANLLISNDGRLRIADFGLARSFDKIGAKERKYTNCVVTRWYRPPELLLGARDYGGEVDLWGIGCVLGEMFFRRPILPGTSDIDQLEKIFQLCGSPNQHSWPNYDHLPGLEGFRITPKHTNKIRNHFADLGEETIDLLDRLLQCNPRTRITAGDALDHDYFWSDPLPADPKSLPSYEASHEYDKRSRRPMPVGLDGNMPLPQVQHRPPPPAMHHFGREGPNYQHGPPPPHFPPHGRGRGHHRGGFGGGGRGRPPMPPHTLPNNPSLPHKPSLPLKPNWAR